MLTRYRVYLNGAAQGIYPARTARDAKQDFVWDCERQNRKLPDVSWIDATPITSDDPEVNYGTFGH